MRGREREREGESASGGDLWLLPGAWQGTTGLRTLWLLPGVGHRPGRGPQA